MVWFTHVTGAQSALYKRHLLSEDAVKNGALLSPRLASLQVIDCSFMRGCDGVHTVIRKCEGQMDFVSEGHPSDGHCHVSHHFIHPVSLTSGLSVLKTEINDNGKSLSAHRRQVRQEVRRSELNLFCPGALFCLLRWFLPTCHDTASIHMPIKSVPLF